MAKLTRTSSIPQDSNSGKLNSKNYPFYMESVLNATIPSWFVDCSREDAETMLKTKHPNLNVVLMRPSARVGCMALSVQTIIAGNTEFNHYSVVKSTQGYIIDIDRKHRPMKTLSEVIDQFVKMASTASRNYKLFDGKPIALRSAYSLKDRPSDRKDAPETNSHKTMPLPPTPGPPKAPPRPLFTAIKKEQAFSTPNNAVQEGYVPILNEDGPDGFDHRPVANRVDYLTMCEGDESCGTQATANSRDDYLTVSEGNQSPKHTQRRAPVINSDYLVVSEDPPENDSTQQLQGLRIDDQEHYLTVSPDDENGVSPTATKHMNNKNNTKVQPVPKRGPPPTAPRPTARS